MSYLGQKTRSAATENDYSYILYNALTSTNQYIGQPNVAPRQRTEPFSDNMENGISDIRDIKCRLMACPLSVG